MVGAAELMDAARDGLDIAYAQMTEATLLQALQLEDPMSKKMQVQKICRDFAKNGGKARLVAPAVMGHAQATLR